MGVELVWFSNFATFYFVNFCPKIIAFNYGRFLGEFEMFRAGFACHKIDCLAGPTPGPGLARAGGILAELSLLENIFSSYRISCYAPIIDSAVCIR